MIKLTELRLFDCTAGGTVVPDVFFDNALRTCVADVGEMAKVKIHLQRKKKAAQIQVVSVVEQPAHCFNQLRGEPACGHFRRIEGKTFRKVAHG